MGRLIDDEELRRIARAVLLGALLGAFLAAFGDGRSVDRA
jgi:hypothetical protein